jgi:hypothetical protein
MRNGPLPSNFPVDITKKLKFDHEGFEMMKTRETYDSGWHGEMNETCLVFGCFIQTTRGSDSWGLSRREDSHDRIISV